jgi:hypothetical protein
VRSEPDAVGEQRQVEITGVGYVRLWHKARAQLGVIEGTEAAALPTFAPESPGWINLIHAHLWDNDAAN